MYFVRCHAGEIGKPMLLLPSPINHLEPMGATTGRCENASAGRVPQGIAAVTTTTHVATNIWVMPRLPCNRERHELLYRCAALR